MKTMTKLQEFRMRKDEFFAHDPQSPLTAQQKHEFKGLKYFPEAPEWNLEVQVERFPVAEKIDMQTSTGDIQTYQRYGKFRFMVAGQEDELTIYADDNGFFMPFVDSLAGKETYPAGRYLEPQPSSNDRFRVDFYLAYNPYCAYNERWSCPLTPAENRLKLPVRAGEKMFHS